MGTAYGGECTRVAGVSEDRGVLPLRSPGLTWHHIFPHRIQSLWIVGGNTLNVVAIMI